jgi:hypothetical protein
MGKGWFGLGKNDGKGDRGPKPAPVTTPDPAQEWALGWSERARTGITPDMARDLVAKMGGEEGDLIGHIDMIRCLCVLENERQQKGA